LNGIAAQAESLGYTLLLKELSDFRANDIRPLLNTLLARQVEGIIWAVPEVGDNRAWIEPQLPGLVVPAIFLTMEAESGISIASIDNYLGGRMATEHLIQQGCSHIAHISGPLDWWEARQRKMGWSDALKSAGLPISENQHAIGNWSASSGAEGISRLLETYPEMDAVFVANDQMALGALQVAYQKGIQIPKNLAMVGFDGIPETAYYCPPLSTVYQDMSALGSIAVRELVNAIEANHLEHAVFEPEQITLQPELVIRESSVLSRG
jgi:LacI family transcriptional regulator